MVFLWKRNLLERLAPLGTSLFFALKKTALPEKQRRKQPAKARPGGGLVTAVAVGAMAPPVTVSVVASAVASATVVLVYYAGAKGEGAEQQHRQGAEKEGLKHE